VVFACVIVLVAVYMLYRSVQALRG
jgi:hypothetical protein